MSKILTLIILFMSVSLFAKSKGLHTENTESTSSFVQAQVVPILRALQLGNVLVQDPNCSNPSYSLNMNLLTASVSGQNFYIVLNQAVVNTKTYETSYCEKTSLGNEIYQIECAANEQSPGTSVLSFLVQYGPYQQIPFYYTIYKCPQVAP